MNTIKRLPTLYIPHGGGPCFFMDPPPAMPHLWDALASYLRGIDGSLGIRPKAVLVISGHWETAVPILQLSLQKSLDPALHLRLGKALAPLRDEKLTAWASAPGGRESHPREEHLIPLMVAAGAADCDPGVRSFNGDIAGKPLSGFQFG